MLTIKRPKTRPSVETELTPMQKSLEVVFGLSRQTASTEKWRMPGELKHDWTVTLKEPITFTVSTKWKNSGGASIANKLNDLFNSDLIKMLGGEAAMAGTPTDAWTQKITEIGEPIGMNLKFRVYNDAAGEINSQTTHETYDNDSPTYKDLIKYFTVICAPAEQYTLVSQTLGPVIAAAKKAVENGQRAKDTYDAASKNGQNPVSAAVKALSAYGGGMLNQAGVNSVLTGPRMNYTLQFKKVGSFTFPDAIDWIVTSFTWTPSTPVTFGDDDIPQPLWVDFDISVETNFAPSNAFVPKMFIKEISTVPAIKS
jgi:hypothetical protein